MVDTATVTGEGFGMVLEGVRRVGSEAARRAEEMDKSGVIPSDLFDDLVATGCFQAMVPKAQGGLSSR